MIIKRIASCAAVLSLAACAETGTGGSGSGGPVTSLPESVVAMAAPNQNLQAVRLMDDGCYWYRHDGPVESTMLPLRTTAGNPICTRAQG